MNQWFVGYNEEPTVSTSYTISFLVDIEFFTYGAGWEFL